MNIAEQTLQLKQDFDEVYEAGKRAGGGVEIDPSKIIEKSTSGKDYVYANDVSEVPHNVSIQLSSDSITDFSNKNVTVCGANLMPFPYRRSDGGLDVGSSRTMGGCTFTVNENREIVVNGKATSHVNFTFLGYSQNSLPPARYVLSGNPKDSSLSSYYLTVAVFNNTSQVKGFNAYESRTEIDLTEITMTSFSVSINITLGTTCDNVIFKPMLSFSDVPYESYVSTDYTPDIDGRLNIKSISPCMSIICKDIDISMSYRKSYGMQTEYDRFWDAFQQNGDRDNYYNGFAGYGWTNEAFKPKYDMYPATAGQMFNNSQITGDLAELLDSLGVTLDFSKSNNMTSAFSITLFSRIGVVDITGTQSSISQLFSNCSKLVTIDKLILRTDGKNNFSGGNQFTNCTALENLTIEGVIGTTGFNVQWSTKLSKASITSIINALSATTSGLTVTLSKTAKEAAFTADEWAELIAERTNWTISLV